MPFSLNSKLSSANSFPLEASEIYLVNTFLWDRLQNYSSSKLSCFNSLPYNKVLDRSKLKAQADDKIKFENLKFVL